jgi:hypothetical protein
MKHAILTAAVDAYRQRIPDGATVGEHTRNAVAIAREWKKTCTALAPNRIAYEVSILPSLNQRIDIYDRDEACAYEFKVSGKNACAEFYKDVVKVLMWNEQKEEKIKKMVFITEEVWGRKHLDTEMPKALTRFLKKHGLDVEIEYINRG